MKEELMKKELTEIVFILDMSGSMQGIKSDAIGGFNAFLAEQKKAVGRTNMTLILFNQSVHVTVEGVDINKVEELNDNTYSVGGMTALLDAIGTGVDGLNKRVSEMSPKEQPTNYIFAIMTDGAENSSRSYSSEMVKNKIQNMTKKDYQFIFLGANIDAVKSARGLGIDARMAGQFVAKDDGGSRAILHANEMVMSYRNAGVMDSYDFTASNKADSKLPDVDVDLSKINTSPMDIGKATADSGIEIGNALKSVSERLTVKPMTDEEAKETVEKIKHLMKNAKENGKYDIWG